MSTSPAPRCPRLPVEPERPVEVTLEFVPAPTRRMVLVPCVLDEMVPGAGGGGGGARFENGTGGGGSGNSGPGGTGGGAGSVTAGGPGMATGWADPHTSQ